MEQIQIIFRGFRLPKYKKFSRDEFLLFFEIGLKSAGFHFQKYKKSFLFRKYKNFLILELESSFSWNIRNLFSGWIFFIFQALA